MKDLKTIRNKKDQIFNGKIFRKCSECDRFKILSQYGPAKWCYRGKRKTCIPCSNKKQNIAKKEYIKKNPDYKTANCLRHKYGITVLQYELLKVGQNNRCAICNRRESSKKLVLSVDHCHKSGDVRGLLCHRCNTGIGFLRENIETLKSAIKYLELSK